MPKNKNLARPNLEKEIMSRITSGQVKMKPKWYFFFGSIIMFFGLITSTITATYLLNLIFFLLRRHGPMGQWRLNLILTSLPWWIPVLAILAVIIGVWLLKKYDFSYQKNLRLIIVIFIISIFLSAQLIDHLGINESWSRRGPMRRFYQNLELKKDQGKLFRRSIK